jgi:LacI family transcriptional regulator
MSSITEVARRAGVSPATASRVVSEADYPVSAATRERVLEAARELDYVPNALARGLLKSRVPVVAVIVHDITDPYFAEVVRGVEDGASAAGYLVITCSSERDAERERSYVRLLRLDARRGRRVRRLRARRRGTERGDGPPPRGDARRRRSSRPPLAARRRGAGGRGRQTPRGSRRWWRRSSSWVTARSRSSPGRGRCSSPGSGWPATGAGLEAAGIAYDERLVVRTSFDAAGGALGVDTLLDGGVPFTAICCANDLLAIGALQRLAALGVDVPGRGLRRRLRRHLDRGADGAGALDRPAAAARAGPLGFQHADAMLAGDEPARRSACRRPSSCAARRARVA